MKSGRGHQNKMESVLESAPLGIFSVDMRGRFSFVNSMATSLLGYEPGELIGMDSHSLCHHTRSDGEINPRGDSLIYAAFREGRIYRVSRDIFWSKNGKSFPVSYSSAPLIHDCNLAGAVVVFQDISRKVQADAARQETRRRLNQVIQGSPVATFVIDENHIVTQWNRACERITGIAAEEIIGTNGQWRSFYPLHRPILADMIVDNATESKVRRYYGDKARPSLLVEGAYEAEDFFPDVGKWLFFTAAPLRNAEGRITGAIETLQDVTESNRAKAALQESEQRYRELSITDNLTLLYNSRQFYNQISFETTRAARYGNALSMLLLDVDNFKNYNDTYGHLEGDKVLTTLADVIRKFLRRTDSGYRFGGEEFTILLPETDSSEANVVAERLRQAFAEIDFSPLAEVQVHVTVSIGVSQYLPPEDASAFIRRADKGTYCAKKLGKNQVVFQDAAPVQ